MLLGVRRVVKVTGLAGLLAAGVLFVAPAPALAAPVLAESAESISSYDVRIDVGANGRLGVTETIAYNFGGNKKHGILREIPTRAKVDDHHNRLYPLTNISVSRDGYGERFDTSTSGDDEVLKIGNPRKTISGTHTYVIRYTMAGALNAFADHVELYFNAIGNAWQVPIGAARATVTGPAAIQRITCYAGPGGSKRPCAQSNMDGASATFVASDLHAGDSLTVVTAFPVGSITGTEPILGRRHTLADGFAITPWTVGPGLALALLGAVGALLIAWRFGRDRYYVGQLPGLIPGPGEPDVQRRKPFFGAPPVSVEFTPPDIQWGRGGTGKVRPGQVGTIVDEKADVVDVTATILDFAVHRHLHITEVRAPGAKKPTDWRLERLTDGDPKFLPYERTLFDALFSGRDSVTLSELKNTFATDLRKVRNQLYADLVAQGWYRQSPATVRAAAIAVAIAVLLASAGITALLATASSFGVIGLGLVLAAIVALVAAPRFPARTGKGSAALARIQGFRLYVATAEAEQIRFQEREQIFSEYLPYAVVFGLAERWAGIFSDIGAVNPDGSGGLYWYAGAPGWNMAFFAGSMSTFTATTGTSLSSTPPSASGSSGFGGGGFSGGGAGGGGGGSW